MKRPSRELNIFSMSALDLFASAMGVFILLTIILFPRLHAAKPEISPEQHDEVVSQLAACTQAQETTEQALQACLSDESDARKKASEVLDACLTERDDLRAGLKACRKNQAVTSKQAGELDKCQVELQSCQQQLTSTFLTVLIKWTTKTQDVDLYVVDARSNVFNYKKHNRGQIHFPDTPAELSLDTKVGPGIEIWEIPEAQVGDYKIYATLWDRVGNPDNPLISGSVYYRGGVISLPKIALTHEDPEGRHGANKKLLATIHVSKDGKVSLQ